MHGSLLLVQWRPSSVFANDRIETAKIGQGENMKKSQTRVRAGDRLDGSTHTGLLGHRRMWLRIKCAFLTLNHDLQNLCRLVVSCGELWWVLKWRVVMSCGRLRWGVACCCMCEIEVRGLWRVVAGCGVGHRSWNWLSGLWWVVVPQLHLLERLASCGELWRLVVSCGKLWYARINGISIKV